MGDGLALGDLGELADHQSKDHQPDALRHGFVQRIAQEIAHLNKAGIRQLGAVTTHLAHGKGLAAPAGGKHHDVVAGDGRHLDALHHAGTPGAGGIRPHDAAGPQDADATQDAQSCVGGLPGHVLAAGHADGHLQSVLGQQRARHFLQVLRDVGTRYRIDGRPTDFQPQAGQRDGAHTRARTKLHLTSLSRQDAQIHRQMGAIGAVRIVARKLLHVAMRNTGQTLALDAPVMDGKRHALPIGQQAFHRFRHLPVDKAQCAGASRRRGAGAGRKARSGAALRLVAASGAAGRTGCCRSGSGVSTRRCGCLFHRRVLRRVHAEAFCESCDPAFFCSASASASSACSAATTRVEPPLRP